MQKCYVPRGYKLEAYLENPSIPIYIPSIHAFKLWRNRRRAT